MVSPISMIFGMMGALGGDLGEFWPTFSGAEIFDRGYLGHFLSDRHKILHGEGSGHFYPEFGEL